MGKKHLKISQKRVFEMVKQSTRRNTNVGLIRGEMTLDKQLCVQRNSLYKLVCKKTNIKIDEESFYKCVTVDDLCQLLNNLIIPNVDDETTDFASEIPSSGLQELSKTIAPGNNDDEPFVDTEVQIEMNDKNEFAKIQKFVSAILERYREVRKECGIPNDGWHSRSIERMASPFIKGYFTLAIVGKVSSGKSTFINALLGCKDLLPTGHDQTTSGITYIEYGDIPEATIVFGDGHKTIITDNISGKIKPYVAIPDKYHNLPVNNIDDMILGGYDFDKIWTVRNQLEEETLCATIDKDLLKDYVANRKKKDIAVDVHLKYPFNGELKGWRVIDTPGIGAIGGIETRTKQLLATQKEDGSREVDAIIFLQNGSQTLDQTDTKRFIKDQLDNFTESDKGRLFYVLTHSANTDFIIHKETKIDFMKQNYGDRIKILTYADSLLYTFLNDLYESDVDLKYYDDFEKPDDWQEDEWYGVMGILDNAKRHIRINNDTLNHDTMLRIIEEWAHFDELKKEINQFAKNEKQKSLQKLINLIANDYLGFVRQFRKDKKLVDGNLESINKEIKIVEDKRIQYNGLAQKADNLIRIDRINSEFAFIDRELQSFEGLQSITAVRTAITNLFDNVQKKEKEVFEDVVKQFSDFFKEYDPEDIAIETIDFGAIETEATSKSQETYEVSPRKVIHQRSKDDVVIEAKYDTRTNQTAKLRNFKALALRKARSQRDAFLPQVKEKVENMRNQIFAELDKKNKEELARLESLKTKLGAKEQFKKENDALIKKSNTASRELIKLAEEYGCKL